MQRTAVALTVQLTLIGPIFHSRPVFRATALVPTNESWLSRASDGRPVEPRNTNPGSPKPFVFGGGTDVALHSNCIGGLFSGWIATPQTTFPCSAVQSCALDGEAMAGAAMASAANRTRNNSRRMCS